MFRKSHDRPRPSADECKSPSARKFRLRKPKSLDSISSRDSTSTASTAAMPRTPVSPTGTMHHNHRHSRAVEFDPLSLHPTFNAPPRLAERPFIRVVDADEAEYYQPRPRRAGPKVQDLDLTPGATGGDVTERLTLRLDLSHDDERPELVRSHWSYSTINTLNSDDDNESSEDEGDVDLPIMHHDAEEHVRTPTVPVFDFESSDDEEEEEEERPVLPQSWQNFSYKRNTVNVTVPRRRPHEAMNSIDHYVKRGCWKRRGIVFQAQDPSECVMERLSARTVG